MKNALRIFFVFAIVLPAVFMPCGSYAQKRIYTRSLKLQDFKSKTTMVVLDGQDAFSEALRTEVTSIWSISPYAFCTRDEYEKQKNSPDVYFIRTQTVKGIVYLTLGRGGNENDADALKRPVTVVSLPVAGASDGSFRTALYMPAFLSIVQDYAEAAVNSEYAAYTGLSAIKRKIPKGVTVISDPAEAARAFRDADPYAAVRLVITPSGDPSDKPRCKLTFGVADYRFYSLKK